MNTAERRDRIRTLLELWDEAYPGPSTMRLASEPGVHASVVVCGYCRGEGRIRRRYCPLCEDGFRRVRKGAEYDPYTYQHDSDPKRKRTLGVESDRQAWLRQLDAELARLELNARIRISRMGFDLAEKYGWERVRASQTRTEPFRVLRLLLELLALRMPLTPSRSAQGIVWLEQHWPAGDILLPWELGARRLPRRVRTRRMRAA